MTTPIYRIRAANGRIVTARPLAAVLSPRTRTTLARLQGHPRTYYEVSDDIAPSLIVCDRCAPLTTREGFRLVARLTQPATCASCGHHPDGAGDGR